MDLHDAKILRTQVDEESACVSIEVRLPQKGKTATLVFEGVRSLPLVAESLKLAGGHDAGNVLDWKPAFQDGNTFIYLLDGVISLWAQRLTIKEK
jgi:hypothetical protein